MNSIFNKKMNISLFALIIIILVIIVAVISTFYILIDPSEYEKSSVIVGSLLTGIILLGVQMLLSKYEFDKIETLNSFGVLDVIKTRKDKNYYASYIDSSETEIDILGVTASRLLEDFASDQDPESTNLINALKRGVKVRILLCSENNLSGSDLSNFQNITKRIATTLIGEYEDFKLRTYDSLPSHSVFRVDNKCIAGPIFSHVDSKNSPGILMKGSSKYVMPYLKNFEKMWEDSTELELRI